jgi:hypothetical protein
MTHSGKKPVSMVVDSAVYALDASTIDLTLALFPCAEFRTTKGTIKLQYLSDLKDYCIRK